MQIDLPEELVERIRHRAASANGASEADVLRQALDSLDSAEEDYLSPEEMEASLAVIDKSMEEIRDGKSLTLEEARQMLKTNLRKTDQ